VSNKQKALAAATDEAFRLYPENHTVDDPFGATGEAESDPYGYEECARIGFIAGARFMADALETAEKPTAPAAIDERIVAWDRIASHPFFRECYATNDTLIAAMLDKLSGQATTVEWGVEIMPEPMQLVNRHVSRESALYEIAQNQTSPALLCRTPASPWEATA